MQGNGDAGWLLRTMERMVRCHSVGALLDLAYEAIRDGLGYDRVGFKLRNEERTALILHIGTDQHGHKFYPRDRVEPLRQGAYNTALLADPCMQPAGCGFVYRPNATLETAPEERQYLDGAPDQNLLVSLRTPDAVLGFISVDNLTSGRPISPDSALPLVAFAGALATAVENVWLLEERARRIDDLDAGLRRRVAELEWLRDVGRRVNAARTLDEVLDVVYDGIHDGLNFDRVGIQVLDHERGLWVELRSTDVHGRKMCLPDRAFPLTEDAPIKGLPGIAALLSGAEFYYTPDAAAETPPAVQFVLDGAPTHYLVVPLRSGEALTGMVSVDNMISGRPITPDDAGPLQAFANQIATAVENARLLERERAERAGALEDARRLAALNRVAEAVIGAPSFGAMCDRTLAALAEVLGARIGRIFLYDELAPPERALRVVACRGLSPQEEVALVALPLGAGLAGQAALQRTLIWHARLDEAPPEVSATIPLARQEGIEARAAAPLLAHGRLLGALVVAAQEPHPWSSADLSLLQIMANQLAAAVETEQLRSAAAEATAAREADRLKGELLSTVSHELRTPLGAIKGFTSSLRHYGDRLVAAERAEALRFIDEGADRLGELIDNLLDVQRMEAAPLSIAHDVVDLAALAETVVTEMAAHAPSHSVDLIVTPGESRARLPYVMGDRRRLRQVLQNLVENAIKYSPDGGRVVVRLSPRDGAVELRVEDDGIGILPIHLSRIFERFHRVDNSLTRRIGGTGLGLAIVKGLVTAHGGAVYARSAGEGRGSTFVVTLPALSDEANALPGAAPAIPTTGEAG